MRKQRKLMTVLKLVPGVLALTAAACGGGGGGGGGNSGGGNPPPPSAVTYSVTLTGITLTDRQTNTAVAATGLPLSGAVVTRNP